MAISVSSKTKYLINSTNLICLVGFLDLLGVSMVLPLIQQHLLDMGASATRAGFVGSIYGLVQLFSSPIMGKWSDTIGRKYALMLCLGVCGVSYVLMGAAFTVVLLALTRIPLGIFKHSQMLSKAFLSDITPASEMSTVYGRFNAISVFGFIVGPTLAGHLAQRYEFVGVASCTGAIFLLNAVIVWRYLPARTTSIKEEETDEEIKPAKKPTTFSLNIFRSFRDIDWRKVGDLLTANFLIGIAAIIYRSNYLVTLTQRFSTTSVTNGYLISAGSAVSTLLGLTVGYVTRFVGDDKKLLKIGTTIQIFTYIGMALAPTLLVFIAFQLCLSAVTAVMRVVTLSLLLSLGGRGSGSQTCGSSQNDGSSKSGGSSQSGGSSKSDCSSHGSGSYGGSSSQSGALIGVSQSVLAMSRTVAPFVAGLAYDVHISGPLVTSAVLSTLGLIVLVLFTSVRDRITRNLRPKPKTS